MRLITSLTEKIAISRPVVFTFGTFDGVHLGHQYIFHHVKTLAESLSAATCALTFSNHPSEILFPESPILKLTSDYQKVELLTPFFDYLIDIPFTESIRNLSAAEFLSCVRESILFSHIVVGQDVRFGKKSSGDYRVLADSQDFESTFLERFCVDGTPVSSSYIRRLIQEAKFKEASRFLGRPFSHLLACKEGCIDLKGYVRPPDGKYAVKVKKDEGWKESFVYLSCGQLTIQDEIVEPIVEPLVQIQYVDGPL